MLGFLKLWQTLGRFCKCFLAIICVFLCYTVMLFSSQVLFRSQVINITVTCILYISTNTQFILKVLYCKCRDFCVIENMHTFEKCVLSHLLQVLHKYTCPHKCMSTQILLISLDLSCSTKVQWKCTNMIKMNQYVEWEKIGGGGGGYP